MPGILEGAEGMYDDQGRIADEDRAHEMAKHGASDFRGENLGKDEVLARRRAEWVKAHPGDDHLPLWRDGPEGVSEYQRRQRESSERHVQGFYVREKKAVELQKKLEGFTITTDDSCDFKITGNLSGHSVEFTLGFEDEVRLRDPDKLEHIS